MKHILITFITIALLAGCGQARQKQTAAEPNGAELLICNEITETWSLLKIDRIGNSDNSEDHETTFLRSLNIRFNEDTIIINNDYKASFKKEKYDSKKYFRHEYLYNYFVDFFKQYGVDVSKEIPCIEVSYEDANKEPYDKLFETNTIIADESLLVIVLNDKIAVFKSSNFSEVQERNNEVSAEEELIPEGYIFDDEVEWEGVKWQQYQHPEGYEIVWINTFVNLNLQQVYDIVKERDIEHLKTELPANDIVIDYESAETGCLQVEYQYKTKQHLYIELFYEGGMTYIEIIERENETQAKITYSPD